MKMKDFLRAVLPEKGVYYAARWVIDLSLPRKGKWKNYQCRTLNDLAIQLKQIGNDKVDAYYAMAAFEEGSRNEEGKWRSRTQDKARVVKCQWLDIDCGQEKADKGKGYATQAEGGRALAAFLKDTGLPMPTYLLSSGNGLHAYWMFTQEVPTKVWTTFALKFKGITHSKGFLGDDSRTADSASVLRPVGAYNYKDPDNPKEVRLLREGKVVGFKTWATKVREVADELGVPDYQTRPQKAKRRSKNAMLGEVKHKPSDANKLADQCVTIGAMRDSLGADQDDTLWYNCLGVLAYTEQGDEICHEWSKGHPDYEHGECQAKIEQRRAYPPTTCDYMRTLTGSLCGQCTKKCRSPIVLGHPDAEHISQEEIVEEGEIIRRDDILPMPGRMGEKYAFDPERGGLLVWTTNKDGEEYQKPFCSAFPTIEFIFLDSGDKEYYARVVTRTRPGEWEVCDITAASLAQGGAALSNQLGKRAGIVTSDQKELERYMQTWFDQTRRDQALQIMRRQMGWQDDDGAFVLGSKAFLPSGDVTNCTLSKDLVKYAEAHVPRGNMDMQIQLIDELYNRPFHEHFQFVFAASLGSILLSMIHDGYIGIPISLWEPDGGQGKTTACTAAIALWGNHKGHGQVAHANKITEYATYVIAGIRRHLPVLIDETTNWDGVRVAKFAYDYSDGVPKIQGKADGGIRDNGDLSWQNFLFLTGNSSLITKMEASLTNCGPQVARVFEIEVPSDKKKKKKKLDPANREKIQLLFENTGHIGPVFAKYVARNYTKVKNYTNAVYNQLQKEVDNSPDARFWLHTAACVIAANKIAIGLGLFKWDGDHLNEWVKDKVRELRGISNEMSDDAPEMLSKLFNDLRPGLLTTDIWGGYNNRAMIDPNFPPPRSQEFTGRYITEDRELYVPIKHVKTWCNDRNLPYKTVMETLEKAGWLKERSAKKSLTVGTKYGSIGQARCWRLKFDAGDDPIEGAEPQEKDDE
jgi:hypothetical protein